MQQIFSLSSVVEKVQQVQQQQTDIQARQNAAKLAELSEQKKEEVQQFESVTETVIRDKKRESSQPENYFKENKKKNVFPKETEKKENEIFNVKGRIIDIIV